MQVLFKQQKNIKDLFIYDYRFVPKQFKNHIPPPDRGWISFRYKKDKVEILLNEFTEQFKIIKTKIDTISLEKSKLIEQEFFKWNNLAKLNYKKEQELLNQKQNDYNNWLLNIIKNNNSIYRILNSGEVLDEFDNYIMTLCYTEIGLTLDEVINIINETRNKFD